MIGLVLVAAVAPQRRYAGHVTIVGVQPNLATVRVGPHANWNERRDAVSHAIVGAEDGAGVIVVADMFGATPCNLALCVAALHRRRFTTAGPDGCQRG